MLNPIKTYDNIKHHAIIWARHGRPKINPVFAIYVDIYIYHEKTDFGESSMMRASRSGDIEVVRFLLATRQFANIRHEHSRYTPLEIAIIESKQNPECGEIVKIFVKLGYHIINDFSIRQDESYDLLLFTLMNGTKDMAFYLIDNGVRITDTCINHLKTVDPYSDILKDIYAERAKRGSFFYKNSQIHPIETVGISGVNENTFIPIHRTTHVNAEYYLSPFHRITG